MSWFALTRAGGDEPFRAAILSARARFHIVYRLTVRATQLLSLGGAANQPGLWRLALPGFVLLDILLWRVLRRQDRYGLWWRLLLDTADVAFWSVGPQTITGHYDLAVLVAAPLTAEASFRRDAGGLLVLAVIPTVTAIARVALGRPALPFTFGWLLLAVAIGIALSRYCRRLNEEAEQEHQDRMEAGVQRAFLAGQNAVAMGASSVVDAIEGVVPVLGQPPPRSALWVLAEGWKAQLSVSTARQATYLQVALRQWELAHNRHPDLSSHVWMSLPDGQGTILLIGSQVAGLASALSALGLRGAVPVCLIDPATSRRLPGAPVALDVGGQRVDIPADSHRPLRPVDPGPIGFVYIAAFLARGGAGNSERIPVPILITGVAMCLAVAWWSHLQLRKLGQAARPSIVWAALGVAIVYTTLASLTMRSLFTLDGDRQYGFNAGLLLVAFIAGVYHQNLTRHDRFATAFGFGLICVLGWTLTGGPSTPAGLGLSLLFAITPYPPCRRAGQELERAAAQRLLATQSEDQAAASKAFDQGRTDVLTMVWRARDDAYRKLEEVAPGLEPERRAVVVARLEGVDQRLRGWDAAE